MNNFLAQFSTINSILLVAFAAFFLVQLVYLLFIYIRVPFALRKSRVAASSSTSSDLPPVSVVICAKNEEQNLLQYLPMVLEQQYPKYEVVVVDDCSEDNTAIVLGNFKKKYEHLKVTYIKMDSKFTHGKKLALTVGIKAAQYDWLLLTDSDCMPASPQWLSCMAANFQPPTEVVLGYGGYMPKPGLLNKFIRLDTLYIALNYIGFASLGLPYMGVGRNLAYRKELFFKNKGFATHNHLASGDDDLFVQAIANGRNTKVEVQPMAHTRSVPSGTFAKWIAQKTRHLTTSSYYRGGIKFSLALEPLSRLLFWILGIALLFLFPFPEYIAGAMLLRLIIASTVLLISAKRLDEKKLLLPSLAYDLLSPLLWGGVLILSKIKVNKQKWM